MRWQGLWFWDNAKPLREVTFTGSGSQRATGSARSSRHWLHVAGHSTVYHGTITSRLHTSDAKRRIPTRNVAGRSNCTSPQELLSGAAARQLCSGHRSAAVPQQFEDLLRDRFEPWSRKYGLTVPSGWQRPPRGSSSPPKQQEGSHHQQRTPDPPRQHNCP